MAFLAAEKENRRMKDLLQADLGRVPERFLLSVGTNIIVNIRANIKVNKCFNALFHPGP